MLSTMRRRFYDQNLRGFTTKYKSPVSQENRGCRLQSRWKKKKIQKENSGVTMERIKMEKRGTAYDAKTNMVALLLWLRCMGATGTWKLVFIGNFTADSRSRMTTDLYQCILLRFSQMLQNKRQRKNYRKIWTCNQIKYRFFKIYL